MIVPTIFIYILLDKAQRIWAARENTSPSVSEDGSNFKGGEEMTGKRSNSSNERSDNSKNGSKGRLNNGSKGNFGSKGSLLSKADADLDGEYEHVSSKLYPKEIHQNTTLQIVKKGKYSLKLT